MKKFLFGSILLTIMLMLSNNIFADSVGDMIFYSEEYPPYNFTENRKPRGISIEVLKEMLKILKAPQMAKDIRFWPWANSYKKLQKEKNTCLFTTIRSKEREKKFKWVGPISNMVIGLIALKQKKIQIESFDDIKNYTIGGIRNDASVQLLLKKGIPKKNIEQVAKTRMNIDKLNFGRIDAWAYGVNVAMWELKSHGFKPEDYEVAFILEDKYDGYYAINKNTSDAIVEKLQWALDEVKRKGIHQEILDKYLK